MKINFFTKLVIISVVMLAGIGLTGFAVFKSKQKFLDSEKLVDYTEQVILQSGEILSQAISIETASRGFVITNDSSYLEPLFIAKAAAFESIAALRLLTKDKPIQQQRIDSVGLYMQKRMDFSLQCVEIRSSQGLPAAIAYASQMQGKLYTDNIRKFIKAIQQDESSLLAERKDANKLSINLFNRLILFTISLNTFLAVLLLILIRLNFLQNIEKEKRAAELLIANLEKEKQVAENKELEAFSYSVSHDLRAPLRHINGFVDLLVKNNSSQLNETGLRYLKIISDSSQEMGNLIDALLAFSRLSRTELQRSHINSADIVKRAINNITDELAGRDVTFNIKELPDINADESLIYLVWLNLISNAVKYSKNKEKAVIEIGGKTENKEVIFYIKDNGAGFNMKYADKLFGVFQRLHKANEFEGIGIGLANVSRIISRHGGTCRAESEVDKGATFYFSLPVYEKI